MPTQDRMLEDIMEAVRTHKQTIAIAYEEIEKLQNKCPHTHAVREYGSDTGNYDPSEDSHWCTFECPHCGKRWRVDSDHPDYRRGTMEYTSNA